MNIILANCMFGQRKIGVENAPKLIYKNLFNYNKLGVKTNISSISSEKFQSNLGYNLLYEEYNKFYKQNFYPIITFGGDHSISIGTCQAFLDKYKEDAHIIWLDAHTDINTSRTTTTNNLHGMIVSKLMGIEDSIISNKKYDLKPEQITYLGPRSIDKHEISIIKENQIKLYTSEELKQNRKNILEEIYERTKLKMVHLSVDFDVFDPKYISSTGTPVENGLNPKDLNTILYYISSKNLITSCDFVEFNPKLGCKSSSLKYVTNSIHTVLNNITFLK